MNEIIQTEVNEELIVSIEQRIAINKSNIKDLNKENMFFNKEKRELQMTYFCGKLIRHEKDVVLNDKRSYYELIVEISNTYSIRAIAYTNASDKISFVARIEGHVEDDNIQFDIETFDEAKQICRQWLADLIHDKYSCEDK